MSELPIEANICEINGPYFQVKLCAAPRVGDLIDLYSLADAATMYPPRKFYEVVAVKHILYDLTDKVPNGMEGCHSVTVYVKESTSEFFNTETPPGPGCSTRN